MVFEDGRRIYFRVQPPGLGVRGHRSETSNGERRWLHVYTEPWEPWSVEVSPGTHGTEVVLVAAGDHRPNGDVEGVEVDPVMADVVGRFTFGQWARKIYPQAKARLRRAGDDHSELRELLMPELRRLGGGAWVLPAVWTQRDAARWGVRRR